VQGAHVFEEGLDVFFGVLADAYSGGRRVLNNAVVDVGEVHHLHYAEALGVKEPAQDVLKREGAKVSYMGKIIDRRAAGVDSNLSWIDWLERFQAVR